MSTSTCLAMCFSDWNSNTCAHANPASLKNQFLQHGNVLKHTWSWRLDYPRSSFMPVQLGSDKLGKGLYSSAGRGGELGQGHGPGKYSPRKDAPTITTFLLVASFTTRLASSGVRMLKTFSISLPLQLRVLGLKNTEDDPAAFLNSVWFSSQPGLQIPLPGLQEHSQLSFFHLSLGWRHNMEKPRCWWPVVEQRMLSSHPRPQRGLVHPQVQGSSFLGQCSQHRTSIALQAYAQFWHVIKFLDI